VAPIQAEDIMRREVQQKVQRDGVVDAGTRSWSGGPGAAVLPFIVRFVSA
jgi:hypothetical protein